MLACIPRSFALLPLWARTSNKFNNSPSCAHISISFANVPAYNIHGYPVRMYTPFDTPGRVPSFLASCCWCVGALVADLHNPIPFRPAIPVLLFSLILIVFCFASRTCTVRLLPDFLSGGRFGPVEPGVLDNLARL